MRPTSYDTETFPIRPGLLAPPLVCLSTSSPGIRAMLYHVVEARPVFERILQQDPIFGANTAYDMAVCAARWPDLLPDIFRAYDEDRVVDIQLNQRLIDNAQGRMQDRYNLAVLSKRYEGRDRSAEKEGGWRLRYSELYRVPCAEWPAAAVEYALEDASDTLRIGLAQLEKHEDDLGDATSQARAAFALQLMMCWGVHTDPQRIEALRSAAAAMYADVKAELIASKLVRPDGTRNVRATQRRMLEVNANFKLTESGRKRAKAIGDQEAFKVLVRLDAKHLKYVSVDERACAESGNDLLVKYSRYTQLHGILNTHVPDLLKGVREPIQPSYLTFKETGRTGCVKSRSENKKAPSPTNGFQFQNPKRALSYLKGVGIRECFVARPGRLFADNDFSGLELCTGAQACLDVVGHSRLAEAMNAGRDPHLQFGARLMGITYEEARARRHEEIVRKFRQRAKPVMFGLPGGLGVPGLIALARGYEVELSEDEAKKLIKAWFEEFPEWIDYFKYIRAHIDTVKGVGQIDQLRVKRRRGGVTYTSACNCLDEKTEVLTQHGWVNGFYDLVAGDKILTKNADTGKLEWQMAFRVQRYPNYRGPIVEFTTHNFSAVTTPEHRWLVRDRDGNNVCKTSKEIGNNGDYRIHRAGDYEAPKTSPYTDDFVELVGWVLTDGNLAKGRCRVSVYQSERGHPALVRRIDALFRRLKLTPSRRGVGRGGIAWTMGSKALLTVLLYRMFPERVLSIEFLLQLTRKQLELLWTVMMLADGSNAGVPYLPSSHKKHVQVLTARSKPVADAFQLLCTLVGFSSVSGYRDLSQRKTKKYASMPNTPKPKGAWLVRVLKRDTVQIVNLKRKYGKSKTVTHQRVERIGRAKMWCPVVPNTYFVARRLGAVFITGNTLFQGLGADGAKAALYEAVKRCYLPGSILHGARPVGFIHDEILAEVLEEIAAEQATEMARVMEEACNRYLPDVPVKCDPVLSKRWCKNAESVYDKSGRLQPWDLARDGRWEVYYKDGGRVEWK